MQRSSMIFADFVGQDIVKRNVKAQTQFVHISLLEEAQTGMVFVYIETDFLSWMLIMHKVHDLFYFHFPLIFIGFHRFSQGLHAGYPLVDACMRELSITGYASNPARLNAASFLAHSMSFDWRHLVVS